MQAQVGQEMEFIVYFHVSYKVIAISRIVFLFQCSQGVSRSVLVGCIVPVGVRETGGCLYVLVISSYRGVHRIIAIYGTGRVHSHSSADAFRIAVLSVHVFSVHIHFQVVIEERRSQVDRCGEALEIGCLHDTVVLVEAQRNTVGEVLESAVDRYIVFGAYGCTEHLVLPVGVGITQFGGQGIAP